MLKFCASYFLIVVIFFFFSCTKEVIEIPQDKQQIKRGVLVVNEGNFMYGNGSITYYDDSTGQIIEDIFMTNNGRKLGDVVQSVQRIGEELFIVVNNSGKIEVVDKNNFKSTGTISGLRSPRYILSINAQKAYVSDLYANAISIINPQTKIITGNIPLAGWTEQMVLWKDKVWVSNVYRDKLYIIDANTDKITDSLAAQKGIARITADITGIWALASTNQDSSILFHINPDEKRIHKRISLPPLASSKYMGLIKNQWEIFLLSSKGVSIYHTLNQTLSPLFEKPAQNFYGFGYDAKKARLYVADAKDYIQKSTIYVYDIQQKKWLSNFNAGIISSDFYFY
ncbi:MAG: hypothetical protein RML72_03065 [Bacteroidia bacterium]|nr:hypothetical protein [Bacteroidia bacterium]MDW8157842.1 hypothetical protein [Bacteroidia bacterium]